MWKFFALFWASIVKSGQILSSGNIIIAFSSPSFVGTPNFLMVACLVGPKNNKTLLFIMKNPAATIKCHLYISDACTPTIDYLKLKLYRT